MIKFKIGKVVKFTSSNGDSFTAVIIGLSSFPGKWKCLIIDSDFSLWKPFTIEEFGLENNPYFSEYKEEEEK